MRVGLFAAEDWFRDFVCVFFNQAQVPVIWYFLSVQVVFNLV